LNSVKALGHVAMALILGVVILLITPIVRIRFFIFPVDEIGPLIHYPHHYLWNRSKLQTRRRMVDICVYKPGLFVCNQKLLSQWSQILPITENNVLWKTAAIFDRLNLRRHLIRKHTDYPYCLPLLPSRSFPFLTPLTAEEVARADEKLRLVGFDSKKPYVAIVVRDAAYKEEFRRVPLPIDKKEEYRNNDIDDFGELSKVLTQFQYGGVRMGAKVKKAFPAGSSCVFDYAKSGIRDETTDLYLMRNCTLCVTTGLGLDGVSFISGVPRVLINFFPYAETANAYEWELVLPVRILDRTSGRVLTLKESLLRPSIRHFRGSEEMSAESLSIIRARPEEIAATVEEALLRINGQLVIGDSDVVLQNKYWELLGETLANGPLEKTPRPLISPSFLRRHREWLD